MERRPTDEELAQEFSILKGLKQGKGLKFTVRDITNFPERYIEAYKALVADAARIAGEKELGLGDITSKMAAERQMKVEEMSIVAAEYKLKHAEEMRSQGKHKGAEKLAGEARELLKDRSPQAIAAEMQARRAGVVERLRTFFGEDVEEIEDEPTPPQPQAEQSSTAENTDESAGRDNMLSQEQLDQIDRELDIWTKYTADDWKKVIMNVGVPKAHAHAALLMHRLDQLGRKDERDQIAARLNEATTLLHQDIDDDGMINADEDGHQERPAEDEEEEPSLITPTTRQEETSDDDIVIPAEVQEFAKKSIILSKEEEKFALDLVNTEGREGNDRQKVQDHIEKVLSDMIGDIKRMLKNSGAGKEGMKKAILKTVDDRQKEIDEEIYSMPRDKVTRVFSGNKPEDEVELKIVNLEKLKRVIGSLREAVSRL